MRTWFKKKESPAEAAERQSATLKADQSKLDKLNSMPKTELIEFFEGMKQDLKEIYESDSYAENVVGELELIQTTLFRIDLNLLTPLQARTVYSSLFTELPELVSSYRNRTRAAQYAWDAWRWVNPRLGWIFQSLNNIKAANVIEALNSPQLAITSNPPLSFSKYKSENQKINDTLTRIEELWTKANSKGNTVEDEYFLEQTITSYLPEAWDFYRTFQNTTADSLKEVDSILLEQLKLIEAHLASILKKSMELNLSAMKVQLEFLKGKTESTVQVEEQQLTLN